MLPLLVLFLFASADARVGTDNHKRLRIAGGRPIPITTAPWQAQLCENGVQVCGAAIIAPYWVLSAAHCIDGSNVARTIITGSDKVSKGQVHNIKKIYVHPAYNDDTADSDIALLLLDESIVFSDYQNYIKLPSRRPKAGDDLFISGFGRKGETKAYSSVLRATTVPVVSQGLCQARYNKEPITPNQFCAGTEFADSCEGDSGGPAVTDGELAGIVSSGMDCASSRYFGVYTVVYNYLPWILHYVQPQQTGEAPGTVYEQIQPATRKPTKRPTRRPTKRPTRRPVQPESGDLLQGILDGMLGGLGR